jgi:hypothetical protein
MWAYADMQHVLTRQLHTLQVLEEQQPGRLKLMLFVSRGHRGALINS